MVVSVVALAGCATMNEMSADVSTFGEWPAGRAPGTYAFERLPSQQLRADRARLIEDSARRALDGAGFTPAAEGQASEYVVQLGARVSATEAYYDDPFWWRGGLYAHRFARPWPYYGFGLGMPTVTYEREVALLIRDRKSGQPLYETRASNDGGSPSMASLLPAMFEAAMKDFPAGSVTPPARTTPAMPTLSLEATVLLTMRAFRVSAMAMPPPAQPATLFTIMLLVTVTLCQPSASRATLACVGSAYPIGRSSRRLGASNTAVPIRGKRNSVNGSSQLVSKLTPCARRSAATAAIS